jgi:hypothetical protein
MKNEPARTVYRWVEVARYGSPQAGLPLPVALGCRAG